MELKLLTFALTIVIVTGSPLKIEISDLRSLSEWQLAYQQQLELLAWTQQQQELFTSGQYLGQKDECQCSEETDMLGYGQCDAPSRSKSWCYVSSNAECLDIFSYNNKKASYLACDNQMTIDGDIDIEMATEMAMEVNTIDDVDVEGSTDPTF